MTLTMIIILIPVVGHTQRIWCSTVKISIFYQSDLDLYPMTLVVKLDLDIVNILYHTKNEVSISKHSKVIAQTDRHIDGQTDTHTQTV